jgi:hypothetical protein
MSHARRFDHVGITVADLETVRVFFVGLGLEDEGRMFVEGEFLDSTSSSEWPIYRPAGPTRERLRAGSCRLGTRSRCCVSLEQAARDSRSGCPSSICRSQERSRHRHGPRRISRCGVVARYERDPFATQLPTTKQVHAILWCSSAGLIAGAAFLARHGRWRLATEARAERAQPVDHNQSAFQGIHALNPLMLVDRLAGFRSRSSMRSMPWPPARMVACWRLATLMIPRRTSRRSASRGSGWHVVTVSAFDTPAYTGEGVPEDLLLLIRLLLGA